MNRKIWWGSAALFAGSAVLLLFAGVRAPRPVRKPPPLQIRATELGDRVRVEWNPLRNEVERARGGTLEVNDGGHIVRYPVDAAVLHSGRLDYLRHSNDLLLSLEVESDAGRRTVGIVRALRGEIVAPQGASVAPPPTGQRARGSKRLRARRRG